MDIQTGDIETGDIEQIAAAAEAADGAAPLDEATWLALRHHPERVRRWASEHGFALLIGDELTLVVHPDARARGEGRRCWTAYSPRPPARCPPGRTATTPRPRRWRSGTASTGCGSCG